MNTRLQALAAAGIALAAAIWFACVARIYFMHDDHMYVVTASLIGQYALYTDLVFLQMPLVAYVFAALLKLFSSYEALVLFNIIVTLAACAVALRSLNSRAPWVLLLTWLALMGSYAVITVAGTTSNHALQLLFCAGLMAVIFSGPASAKRAVLAGVLYSLMVQAKLNSLPFALPLALWLWQSGAFWRHGFRAAAAGLVMAIPSLWLLAQNPAAFWYANITAPLLNNVLRQVSSLGDVMTMLLRQFNMPTVGALLLVVAMALLGGQPAAMGKRTGLWVTFITAALVAALLPGKVFDNHLAMFMLAVCSAAGSLLMALHARMPEQDQRRFTLICLLPLALLGAGLLGFSGLLRQEPDKATIMSRVAADYQQALSQQPTCAQQVFSTSAIPLIGGALKLHPASASGPFIIRITPNEVIAQLMQSRSALVVGYHADTPYEQQLVHTAQATGYTSHAMGTYTFIQRTATWALLLPPCN